MGSKTQGFSVVGFGKTFNTVDLADIQKIYVVPTSCKLIHFDQVINLETALALAGTELFYCAVST
jgi:hypothetical protein